jgi:hypothetical protein
MIAKSLQTRISQCDLYVCGVGTHSARLLAKTLGGHLTVKMFDNLD